MNNDAGLSFETDHRDDHEHPNDQQKQTKYKIQNFHYYSHTIIGHSNTGVHFLNLQGREVTEPVTRRGGSCFYTGPISKKLSRAADICVEI